MAPPKQAVEQFANQTHEIVVKNIEIIERSITALSELFGEIDRKVKVTRIDTFATLNELNRTLKILQDVERLILKPTLRKTKRIVTYYELINLAIIRGELNKIIKKINEAEIEDKKFEKTKKIVRIEAEKISKAFREACLALTQYKRFLIIASNASDVQGTFEY